MAIGRRGRVRALARKTKRIVVNCIVGVVRRELHNDRAKGWHKSTDERKRLVLALDEANPGGLSDHAAVEPALVVDEHEADAELDEELLQAVSAVVSAQRTWMTSRDERMWTAIGAWSVK